MELGEIIELIFISVFWVFLFMYSQNNFDELCTLSYVLKLTSNIFH